MLKYSLLLSYVGTHFCGWQKQKGSAAEGKHSIQATIEQALFRMTGESVSVVGSGRTDSGVHAMGQVAHFVLKERAWEVQILQSGLNGLLPMSIRVLACQIVPLSFHAQRSAEKKQYSYYFQQGPCPLPHLLFFSWWIRKQLDLKAMSDALQHLIGEHEFKPFQAAGSKPGSTVRSILEADVSFQSISFPGDGGAFFKGNGPNSPLGLIRVRIMGTGFLKQMVRGIAGTLLQVGEKRRPPSCTLDILKSGMRSEVGPTAPARALWLEQVWYPESFQLFDPSSSSQLK